MINNLLIFGDSYSTHKDHIPGGYAFYYCDGGRSPEEPVTKMTVDKTWWWQFIESTDAKKGFTKLFTTVIPLSAHLTKRNINAKLRRTTVTLQARLPNGAPYAPKDLVPSKKYDVNAFTATPTDIENIGIPTQT